MSESKKSEKSSLWSQVGSTFLGEKRTKTKPQRTPTPLVSCSNTQDSSNCRLACLRLLLSNLRRGSACVALRGNQKQNRILVWGFVVQLFYCRKWQPLSSATRILSYIRERTLIDVWHFAVMFSDDRGLRQGFTL